MADEPVYQSFITRITDKKDRVRMVPHVIGGVNGMTQQQFADHLKRHRIFSGDKAVAITPSEFSVRGGVIPFVKKGVNPLNKMQAKAPDVPQTPEPTFDAPLAREKEDQKDVQLEVPGTAPFGGDGVRSNPDEVNNPAVVSGTGGAGSGAQPPVPGEPNVGNAGNAESPSGANNGIRRSR